MTILIRFIDHNMLYFSKNPKKTTLGWVFNSGFFCVFFFGSGFLCQSCNLVHKYIQSYTVEWFLNCWHTGLGVCSSDIFAQKRFVFIAKKDHLDYLIFNCMSENVVMKVHRFKCLSKNIFFACVLQRVNESVRLCRLSLVPLTHF